VRPPRSYPP